MRRNFGWFIKGSIAVMGRPGSLNDLEDDLLFLRREGIRKIISLTMAPLDEHEVTRFSFKAVHIPIPDGGIPTCGQLEQFVSAVGKWLEKGEKVVIHCGAGYGRSGTMLACYLVKTGLASDEAIERVRLFRPASIETIQQEKCVVDYELHLLEKRLTEENQ